MQAHVIFSVGGETCVRIQTNLDIIPFGCDSLGAKVKSSSSQHAQTRQKGIEIAVQVFREASLTSIALR